MIEVRRQAITGRCVWTGSEMGQTESWIVNWPKEALIEVDHALASVKARGLRLFSFGREEFPLPWLAFQVPEILEELEEGRGFLLLRGLSECNYSKADSELVCWGIGSHLGSAVSQNSRGELLSHVIDKGAQHGDTNVRGYETKAKLFYHNDNGDVVVLFCLQESKSGGASKLVSTATVYNEIFRQHPEYIDELCQGYFYHMRGEQPIGQREVSEHRVPVFSYHAGKLSSRYTRNSILHGANALGQSLTERQRLPLDLIDRLAEEFCLTMKFQRGDIQIVSNYSVLHSRDEFIDFDELDRKRDLLRLWLNIPNARPLTYEFATRYGPGSARRGVPPSVPRPLGDRG